MKLKRYGGGEIKIGDTVTIDRNYHVTVNEIIPPFEDGDPGQVFVTYSWGEQATAEPSRFSAYISLD